MSDKQDPTPKAPKAAPPPPWATPASPRSKRKLVGVQAPSPLPGTTATEGTIGVWGSTAAAVTGYGIVSTAGLKRSATREGYPNADGEFTGYCYYNFLSEGTFEALIPSTGITALDAGDSISIGGTTMLVDNAEELWNIGGWAKYRVAASLHDTVSLS